MVKRNMLKNIICLLVLSAFCITTVNAVSQTEREILKKTNIAKHYKKLKRKADRGEKLRLIVKVKDVERGGPRSKRHSAKFDNTRQYFKGRGLKVKKYFSRLGLMVVEVDSFELDELIGSGLIESVYEDTIFKPHLFQSVGSYAGGQQQDGIIEGGLTHGLWLRGENQAVVIVDSGVDNSHPFFSNRVVEEACFSGSFFPGEQSLCPNGLSTELGSDSATGCTGVGINGCDHGTHVAGIAAGSGFAADIDLDISGVAPGVNIIAIQVFHEVPAASCNYEAGQPNPTFPCIGAYLSDVVDALEWVLNVSTTNNIAAINMSLGDGNEYTTSCDTDVGVEEMTMLMRELKDVGIATVISSGNDEYTNGVGKPACISHAITVGNTDDNDNVNASSNSSSLVDILAPGTNIHSSIIGGTFGGLTGTSMAAPHVAGAFAVMKSINPNLSVDDIETILEVNGQSILDANNSLLFPRLNLFDSAVPPTAKQDRESYSIIVNQSATFSANSSIDPLELPLTYTWNFDDGASNVQTSTASVQHTYSSVGTYSLNLSVNNNTFTSNPGDTVSVTVYDPVILTVIISSLLL